MDIFLKCCIVLQLAFITYCVGMEAADIHQYTGDERAFLTQIKP
jgi:hypothetical protein